MKVYYLNSAFWVFLSKRRILAYLHLNLLFEIAYAVRKLGACPEQGRRIEPRECVVIEDSINGVKSAKRAGMPCIAIPDKRLNQKEFQIADLVIDRLDRINAEMIRGLDRLGIT